MNERLTRVLVQSRNAMGLKQSEVAEMIGVKHNTLSNWENGRTEPDIETFIELCKIYKLDYNTAMEEIYGASPEGFSLIRDGIAQKYNELNEIDKKKVQSYIEFLKSEQRGD